jgi:hypothetical protein
VHGPSNLWSLSELFNAGPLSPSASNLNHQTTTKPIIANRARTRAHIDNLCIFDSVTEGRNRDTGIQSRLSRW